MKTKYKPSVERKINNDYKKMTLSYMEYERFEDFMSRMDLFESLYFDIPKKGENVQGIMIFENKRPTIQQIMRIK